MCTNDLKIRMLGEFSISYQGKPVLKEKNQVTKTMHLLQILLYAGSEGITKERLLFCLFGQNPKGRSTNNLRVIIYNLRRLLRESGLPEEDYICVKNGSYYFVSSFLVEIDARIFESLIKSAKIVNGKDRLELLRDACDLYGGYFLPALSGEEWVLVEEAHYQHLYSTCVEEICAFLSSKGEYEALLKLCSRAADLYPFDEWQVCQIDCLTAMGRTDEALALYERTIRMYFEELQTSPSIRMMECFRRMGDRIRMNSEALGQIREILKENPPNTGAYYCVYPCFADGYRIVTRIIKQTGMSAYLLLCTVMDERKRHTEDSRNTTNISDVLKEALQMSLRRGDVFTQYNKMQYLVLLSDLNREECQMIIYQIDISFRSLERSRKIHVIYQLTPI